MSYTSHRLTTSYARSVVDSHLKPEVEETFRYGLSVRDFVKAVWGFVPQDIPIPNPASPYTIPSDILQRYITADDKFSETNCYQPLNNILHRLLEQLRLPSRSLQGVFTVTYDKTVNGSYAHVKPDLVFSTPTTPIHWSWVLAPFEVKRTAYLVLDEHRHDICIDLTWDSESSSEVPKKDPFLVADQLLASSSSSKRKRATPRQESSRKVPRFRSSGASKMNLKEFQLVSYVHENICHGVRSYVSGIYLCDTNMSLWYADRMGVVRTNSFNFVKEPQLLILVVAAIGSASIRQFGICPLLNFPSSPQFRTYKGSQLCLTSPQDESGEKIKEDVCFGLTKSKPRYTQYGLVGRGTTILDVQAIDKWKKKFGSATIIAKVSWPVTSRKPEDDFIRVIRKKIPVSYKQNIVRLLCSQSTTCEESNLPRSLMEIDEAQEPRLLRVLVMEEYCQLNSVESLKEFRKVFIDVVHGHHYAYEYAKVLHRDLSVNNIMLSRQGGQVIGVLCDWDLASLVNDKQDKRHAGSQTMTARAAHRTGTGPFMAIDLLLNQQARTKYRSENLHLYRFDLESFFYILVWFSASFDPQKHKYEPGAILNKWEDGSFERIGSAKVKLFDGDVMYEQLASDAHEEYKVLYTNDWISNMRLLFLDVNVLSLLPIQQTIGNLARHNSDPLAIEEATKRMRKQGEEREALVTYQTFMSALQQQISEDEP